MPTVATIGVYGFTAASFLDALGRADVRLVLDVRQRRGVRGPQYSWANSLRLQAALTGARVGYRHRRDLAPTTELRHLQYREDAKAGAGKRNRVELAPEYATRYVGEILAGVDLAALVSGLPRAGKAALLCVESDPEACHRSLIGERLATHHGVRMIHLRPET